MRLNKNWAIIEGKANGHRYKKSPIENNDKSGLEVAPPVPVLGLVCFPDVDMSHFLPRSTKTLREKQAP